MEKGDAEAGCAGLSDLSGGRGWWCLRGSGGRGLVARKRSRGEVARRTGEMGSRESGRRVQREGDGDRGDGAGI